MAVPEHVLRGRLEALGVEAADVLRVDAGVMSTSVWAHDYLARTLVASGARRAVVAAFTAPEESGGPKKRAREPEHVLGYAVYVTK